MLHVFSRKQAEFLQSQEKNILSRRAILLEGFALAATIVGADVILGPTRHVQAAGMMQHSGSGGYPPGVLPSGGVLWAYPNAQLGQTNSVSSVCGQYTLILQADGNLVLYDISHHPLWASNTDGNPQVSTCNMQADGNLVIYDTASNPLWASNTNGYDGAHLVVQEDANTVIYDPWGNPCWATNTGTTSASDCQY